MKYDGIIRLCPPDGINDDPNNITSVSFGVVALSFTDYTYWRGVLQRPTDKNAQLGGNEADAICRQLGYTGAIVGSAASKNSSGYTFEHC